MTLTINDQDTNTMLEGLVAPTLTKRRGIQPGQSLMQGLTKDLHDATGVAAREVHASLKERYPNLCWERGLAGETIAKLSGVSAENFPLTGVYPDGGIFLYRHKGRTLPLLATEAKNQGASGNAIERWFKNYEALSCLGPQLAYITLCSGEGAAHNGVIRKTLNYAFLRYACLSQPPVPRAWGHVYTTGPSLLCVRATTSSKRISCILSSVLIQKIESIKRA